MRQPTKQDCYGCRDDYYNQGNGLNGECWHFKTAELVQLRLVPLDMIPPFERQKIETKPSCFTRQGAVKMRVEKKARTKPPYARAEPRKPKVSYDDIAAAFERNKGEL